MTYIREFYGRFPLWVALFVCLVFMLGPLLVIFLFSIDAAKPMVFSFPPREPSLIWYFSIPQAYWDAFGRAILIATAAAVLSTLLGTLAALGIVRGQFRQSQLLDSFFRVPLQVPLVVTGVAFLQFYYHAAGVIGLNFTGTITGIILALTFVCVPYGVGAVTSVLLRISPEHEEAAAVMGATPWSCFWRVTFPMIRPGIVTGLLFSFIVAFGDIPIVIFLAGRNTTTLPVEIFQSLQYDFTPTVFSISSITVIFSLVVIVLLRRLVGLELTLPSQKKR